MLIFDQVMGQKCPQNSNYSIYIYTFFGHNSAMIWTFFRKTLIFWPKGFRPQDPTKKLAHWVDLLGQPLSQKKVFENMGPEPPPP